MQFLDHHLTLPDGRRLAYAALGPADGFPIVYLHGGVGTSLEPSPALTSATHQLRCQWIAVSRPGVGRSDEHPGRTMRTTALDIGALAADRGWPRIAVVGVSTGGPYALSCAATLPQLVGAVAVVASISTRHPPHHAPGLPVATRLFMRALLSKPRTAIGALDHLSRLLHRHQAIGARLAGEQRAPAVRALVAATHRGTRGLVEDFRLCARQAEYDPRHVHAEVHIWHGGRDRIAPPAHARQLAAELPNARTFIDPEETHFFFRRRSADIAAPLVAAARRQQPHNVALLRHAAPLHRTPTARTALKEPPARPD